MTVCAVRSVRSPRIALSVFEPAVIGLYWVVGVRFDVMPCLRNELVEHRGVGRGGVSDHLGGLDLQRLQRPLEESSGSVGVAAG